MGASVTLPYAPMLLVKMNRFTFLILHHSSSESVPPTFILKSLSGSSNEISPEDCPARCITPSASGKSLVNSGLEISAFKKSAFLFILLSVAVARLSTMVTSCPSSISLVTRCEPIKPAPPVTMNLFFI